MPPLATPTRAAGLGRGIADVAGLTRAVRAVSVSPRPVAVAVQGAFRIFIPVARIAQWKSQSAPGVCAKRASRAARASNWGAEARAFPAAAARACETCLCAGPADGLVRAEPPLGSPPKHVPALWLHSGWSEAFARWLGAPSFAPRPNGPAPVATRSLSASLLPLSRAAPTHTHAFLPTHLSIQNSLRP